MYLMNVFIFFWDEELTALEGIQINH